MEGVLVILGISCIRGGRLISQAIILCGGRGERLKPITNTVPKPMVEVCGRPFVSYLVEILRNCGIEDIVLSVGYLKERFSELDGTVRLCDCREKVNDSILSVLGLESRFVVANGDVLPILKWKEFLRSKVGTVAIKTNPVLKDVGVCIVDRKDVETNYVDCGNMRGMIEKYDNFSATGNLHIGTVDGLQLAEDTLKWWWRKK